VKGGGPAHVLIGCSQKKEKIGLCFQVKSVEGRNRDAKKGTWGVRSSRRKDTQLGSEVQIDLGGGGQHPPLSGLGVRSQGVPKGKSGLRGNPGGGPNERTYIKRS